MLATVATQLARHEAAIAEACERFAVVRLDLFGSASTDSFRSGESDFDFAVVFREDAWTNAFDNYFGLKERLEVLLARPVDLVALKSVRNPYLRAAIEKTRHAIYVAPAA